MLLNPHPSTVFRRRDDGAEPLRRPARVDARGRRRAALATGLLGLLMLGLIGPAAADPPTVNGLFYGDGDDAKYIEFATSYLGSKLYVYYDAPSKTLFTALVVATNVNDNVFGQPDGGKTYMASVGWGNGGGQQRGADKLVDSEFAQFTFACAPGSTSVWTWNQGHACQSGGDWIADMRCTTSSGTPPPGYDSATSFAWNMNTYDDAAVKTWDREVQGTRLRDWVSPFDNTQTPPLALGLDGYPSLEGAGFSDLYQYEWRMVYEWSIPLDASGADCGNDPLYVVTGLSHHSPLKEELNLPPPECGDPENDCFPDELTSTDPLSDYGDLPESYGTTAASDGPRHNLKVSSPYLGENIVAELDGQPTLDGTGDGDEEDGITAVVDSDWTAGSSQVIEAVVTNAPGGALLGAWLDWNSDGDFADPGEFSSWTVSEGSNSLGITVGSDFNWAADSLAARFRLVSSGLAAPGGSLDQGDSLGEATDGEVEDYVWSAGTLPVTLNAFASDRVSAGAVTVSWQTASETDNVGYELWGRVDGRWRVLGDFVASIDMDSRLPKDYEVTVEAPPGVRLLQLVDYNSRGVAERYGPFRVGARYGEVQTGRRIDWSEARRQHDRRLTERGFRPVADDTVTWKRVVNPAAGAAKRGSISDQRGRMTHIAVTEPGVQRVTYEALRDAGLDLAGVPSREIALSLRGAPVARWIGGPATFGPGSAIEFVGHPPEGDDALYIGATNYQVAVDTDLAVDAAELAYSAPAAISPWMLAETVVDRPLMYHSQSPTGDPWVERVALARPGVPATLSLTVEIEDEVLDGDHRLAVELGSITDLPDVTRPGGAVIPEHNVEVLVGGPGADLVPVATSSTSGQRRWIVEADLPDGLLGRGTNTIELRFTTDYMFSLVVVDSYGLQYRSPYSGRSLSFAPDAEADGYRIDGFARPSVIAYSQSGSARLTRHQVVTWPSIAGTSAEFRQGRGPGSGNLGSGSADGSRFWVTDSPHTPPVFTTEGPARLLSHGSDLVVIAGSAFVGTPALDRYLADKAEFDPVVVDVEDIYNAYGYGMALPSAITDFLATLRQDRPFDHVQLVGADCWDRRNYVSQCLSFVPLPTAVVGPTRFSPSQNRLADLDGDGVADVALAQFSVRTEDELATIVRKQEAWRASGLSAGDSVLLIAEESDGRNDFLAQVNRIGGALDLPVTDVLDMAQHPDVATARDALSASLDEGRSFTVFSGHSSSVVWAYRGLLTPTTAAELTNFGRPTLLLPLACETTYDISPSADVLGHQLLFAGDQGAVAISGAVSLASLDTNEEMADHILNGLRSGMTLGEAVQAGREALGTPYQMLQDNWLNQGDVTLRMER